MIVAVPVYVLLAVTTPVVVATDSISDDPLHVPPVTASLSVIVDPAHTDEGPEIAAGSGLTASVAVRTQPDGIVYDIVAVPAIIPLAIPVVPPIVATDRLLLLHVPPVDASVNVVVEPTHAANMPDTGSIVLTVITVVE